MTSCARERRPLRLLGLIVSATALPILLSACSLSVPLMGLGPDETPTGSIKTVNPSPFSAEMDGEDWRRAKSALDTALDPQGNGARVAWENPQSGAKGVFVPLAQPYPKDDGICRMFTAELAMKNQSGNHMRSVACRRNGGEWIIGKITAEKSTASMPPRRGNNLAERPSSTQINAGVPMLVAHGRASRID